VTLYQRKTRIDKLYSTDDRLNSYNLYHVFNFTTSITCDHVYSIQPLIVSYHASATLDHEHNQFNIYNLSLSFPCHPPSLATPTPPHHMTSHHSLTFHSLANSRSNLPCTHTCQHTGQCIIVRYIKCFQYIKSQYQK